MVVSIPIESDKTPLNGFSSPYLRCPDRYYRINASLLLRRHCCPHAGSRWGHAADATGRYFADADRNRDDCRHTRYTHGHTYRYPLYAYAFVIYAGSIYDADDVAQRHAHANRDADSNIIAHGDGHAHRDPSAHRDLYQRANGDGHLYAYGRANRDRHGHTNRDRDAHSDLVADTNADRDTGR